MSNMISIEKQRTSEHAVYCFKKECISPNLFKTRVQFIDEDNDNIIDHDSITVSIVSKHAWEQVSIMLEDTGITTKGYRKLGVYGTYSTNFSKMEFLKSTKQLKIYSNDSAITVLIDAK